MTTARAESPPAPTTGPGSRPEGTPPTLAPFEVLETLASELEAFGADREAQAVRETVRRVSEQLAAWWSAPLGFAAAAVWGGYSEAQLRRLVKDGPVPGAPGGGIRRRDVPVRPGHRLPLGLEPAPVAEGEWVADLVERRQLGRSR